MKQTGFLPRNTQFNLDSLQQDLYSLAGLSWNTGWDASYFTTDDDGGMLSASTDPALQYRYDRDRYRQLLLFFKSQQKGLKVLQSIVTRQVDDHNFNRHLQITEELTRQAKKIQLLEKILALYTEAIKHPTNEVAVNQAMLELDLHLLFNADDWLAWEGRPVTFYFLATQVEQTRKLLRQLVIRLIVAIKSISKTDRRQRYRRIIRLSKNMDDNSGADQFVSSKQVTNFVSLLIAHSNEQKGAHQLYSQAA